MFEPSQESIIEPIGFIGLGNMGYHMASRLVNAGHPLIVYDVSSGRAEDMRKQGAAWATSPKAVAESARVVFLCLPTPKVVEHVLLGEDGLCHGSAIEIVVDTSTTGPDATVRLADLLRTHQIDLIDAPISGGTAGAENGSLTIMASGSPRCYEAVLPLLRQMGSKQFFLGDRAGQAQTMKVINNMMCATATLAAFEGLVLGSKVGLDGQTMLDVLNASSGRSFATQVKIPQCVLSREFPMQFPVELMLKDVKLCLDEASRAGVPMWVNDATRQMLAFAVTQGNGADDYGTVIQQYETWAGTQFGRLPASSK